MSRKGKYMWNKSAPVLGGVDFVDLATVKKEGEDVPALGSAEFVAQLNGYPFHFLNAQNAKTFAADPYGDVCDDGTDACGGGMDACSGKSDARGGKLSADACGGKIRGWAAPKATARTGTALTVGSAPLGVGGTWGEAFGPGRGAMARSRTKRLSVACSAFSSLVYLENGCFCTAFCMNLAQVM